MNEAAMPCPQDDCRSNRHYIHRWYTNRQGFTIGWRMSCLGCEHIWEVQVTLDPFPFGPQHAAEGLAITESSIHEGDSLVVLDVVDSFTDETGSYSEVEVLVVGTGQPEFATVIIYQSEPAQPCERFDVWVSDAGWLLFVGD